MTAPRIPHSKRVIIIGATSGIGRALANHYAQASWELGLSGRRIELLHELQAELPCKTVITPMDVSDSTEAVSRFDALARELGSVDLVIIAAGTGHTDPELPWELERATIRTNVEGFSAIALASWRLFKHQGFGHLAAISSVAGRRGGPSCSYNASKAFMSNYMEGLRYLSAKSRLPIHVTDIRPGFVKTRMAQGDGLFWVAEPAATAEQIAVALERKRSTVYITRRWRLVAWLLALLPDSIYHRL